jgi:predicted membrane channel-forming protein YqfA (hemolysin III family)
MTLLALACGIGLFAAVLVAHVLMWNLLRIRKELLWLAFVFFVIPGVVLLSAWSAGFLDASSVAASGMLYASLAVVYVQTYPALREDIPSIRILMSVHRQSGGMTRSEIIEHLEAQGLFDAKIQDLQDDALVRVQDDRLYLTAMGARLAGMFHYYRKLLGHALGRG